VTEDPFIQLLKKIFVFIITIILIATVIFVLFRVLPSDPIQLMFKHNPGPDVKEFWRHTLGLDKSLPEQYVSWMVGAFTGNFGFSSGFAPREQIGMILPTYIERTLFLFSSITAISLILGALLGRFVVNRKDQPVDKILSPFAAIFFSAPAFIVTLLTIMLFANLAPDWPFQGPTSDSWTWSQLDTVGQILDALKHALIPVATVVIPSTAMMMLVFRKGALDLIRNPTSRTSGSRERSNQKWMKHSSFFGSLSKSMPLVLMTLAWIMVGVIAVEYITTYKGLGYLLWESVLTLDIPLLMAVMFLLLVIVVSACFLIDFVIWIMTLRKEPIPTAAMAAPQTIGVEESIGSQTSVGYAVPDAPPSLLAIGRSIFSQLLKRPLGAISMILLIVMLVIALVGPLVAPENPMSLIDPGSITFSPQPPSGDHLLGTDYRSKDIFSQMLWGGWPIMLIGIAVLTISALIGALFGAIAGSFIRILDTPIMIIADMLTAIPAFLILLALFFVLGRSEFISILMITLLAAAPVARSVRDALVSDRAEKPGNNSSNPPSGISQSVTHDIIPKAIPGMLSSLKFVVVIAILTSVFIEFFGLGGPYVVSWGWMIERAHDGSAMVYFYWWWILPPIIAIVTACASFYFLIDALEDITRKMFSDSGQKPSTAKPSIPPTPSPGFAQP
jgi:peptide/nickel transport system permease protein